MVVGRATVEMGIWGVKGDGGSVRLEERKGVGDMDSVERIFGFWI